MSPGELPMVHDYGQLELSSRPLLLVVQREPALARALEDDLGGRFGPHGFDAVCVDSTDRAMGLITSLAEDRNHLALLLVDQEVGVSGSALIATARELHPQARTVLLIDHDDTDAALDALNRGRLDYFFLKPLREHDEQLLPVVDDLLGEWRRRMTAVSRATHVIGDRASRETLRLREFLRRNDIHHRVLDPVRDREAIRSLLDGAEEPRDLPAIVLDDGSRLERPSLRELAERLGLQTTPRRSSYDLVIVGGGPAGLAAAVYGASEGLATILVEQHAPGGQAGQSSRIENYLGFPSGLSGSELTQRALRQALRFRAEVVRPCEVTSIGTGTGELVLGLSEGAPVGTRTVLICCGVQYRRLDVEGLDRLIGRGVNYGAGVAEAEEIEGKSVAIVGGANSAGQAALDFARRAGRVTLLVRADSVTTSMSRYLSERIVAHERIEVRTATEVVGVVGEHRLEAVRVTGGREEAIAADELFIFIGAVPRTTWLPDEIGTDEHGFVLSGRDALADGAGGSWKLDRDPYPLETTVPGVFVAGDARNGSIKRVASAVGEGAMAVQLIHRFLDEATPA